MFRAHARSQGDAAMAELKVIKTAAETALAQAFAQARPHLPGGEAIAKERAAAFDVFAREGLPHRRVEDWKYTDLRALMRDAKPLASPPDAQAKAHAKSAGALLDPGAALRLVFVDGAFVPELSDAAALEEGLSITSLATALADNDEELTRHLGKLAPTSDVAVALNTALMGDGAVIRVQPGATIKRPLHLVFAASEKPAASFARSLMMVGEGARVMLIESYEGPAGSGYQANAALEIFVGDKAHVDHVKVIGEGADALHISTLAAAIGARARFNTFSFVAGGAVIRNQLFLKFDGEETVAHIGGATLLKGRQHADTHARRQPHRARLSEPGSVQVGARRRGAWRIPGPHRGAAGGAADRRQDDDAGAAFVGRGRGRQQAGTGDLRRRRAMRPRRDGWRARRGAEILSDGARHSGRRGRGASDPGVPGRGDRRHRACRHARGADRTGGRVVARARIGFEMHPAVSNGAYDVNRIRADFPILATKVYGKPLVYLDNAASAQKPQAVLDRLNQAYTSQYANVHRGLHYLANEATEAYEGAREKVAAFLNARRKEEIIFTRNATEAINLVAYTFGRERIREGDEIILSIMEHHSNIVPWHFLRERQGAVIKWAPVDDEGNFLVEEFEKLITRAHQDGGDHPHVEHAGHAGAGERGDADRARPRRSGADRRRAGRGARRRRCAGHRLRLLRLDRAQALRPVRHRRALRQIRVISRPCRRSTAAAR